MRTIPVLLLTLVCATVSGLMANSWSPKGPVIAQLGELHISAKNPGNQGTLTHLPHDSLSSSENVAFTKIQKTSGTVSTTLHISVPISLSRPKSILSVSAVQGNSSSVANVRAYGASGSDLTTLGSISPGSPMLKLSNPIDFKDGMGIFIPHAGPMPALERPDAPAVTIGGGPRGHYSYTYRIVAIDGKGGVSAASSKGVMTKGPKTLGGLGQTGAQNTGRMSHATWLAISIPHHSNPNADYAVYRTSVPEGSGLGTGFIGIYSYTNAPFLDFGQAVKTPPPGIPVTPPTAPEADSLVTTVLSGAGTHTLTLSDAALTGTSEQTIYHDDTAAFERAIKANKSALYVPAGNYGISSMLNYGRTDGVFYGDGANSVIRYQGNLNSGLDLSASGITLKGIRFDGQKVSNELVGIHSEHGGLHNVTVENTSGRGSRFYGIHVYNSANSTAVIYKDIRIIDNNFADCEYTYATLGNVRNVSILNNQVSFTDYNYAGRGISLHNLATPQGYTYAEDYVIRGNVVHSGNHSAGIVIQGGGTGTVENNKLFISGGIYAFWGIGAGRDLRASGGYTFDNNQCIALWQGTGVAVHLTNVANVDVKDNTIRNFGYDFRISGYGGPALPDSPSNHVIVENNKLSGTADAMILGKTPQSAQYANNG